MKPTDSKEKIRVNLTPLFDFMQKKGVTQGSVADDLEVSRQTLAVTWRRGRITEKRLWELYVAVKYRVMPEEEKELEEVMEQVKERQEVPISPGQFSHGRNRDMLKVLELIKKHRYTIASIARAGGWSNPARVTNLLHKSKISDAAYERVMEAVGKVMAEDVQARKELRQLEKELD